MLKKFVLLFALSVQPLFGTLFHGLNTAETIYCTFSNKFQNRIMLENGKIQKIISSDEEKLSIFLEPLSGQAFIYVLDPNTQTTTLSVITDQGVVQDIQIAFTDRSSETVILKDLLVSVSERPVYMKRDVMAIVSDILLGCIPEGYIPCSISCQKWQLKKGIELELLTKLEGPDENIYVYQVINTSSKKQKLMECELQFSGSQWIFLESNSLCPKQKILSLIAVKNNG